MVTTHRTRFIYGLLLAAGIVVTPATLLASESPVQVKTAERCRGDEFGQFDFWIGSWEVRTAENKLIGHNEITPVSGGCALLENWHGLGGGSGMSINTYDTDRGKWTQRWVGAGATLWLEGGLVDGSMVLTGTAQRSTPKGKVLDRITWTPLPDGRVRQTWELSSNEGKTWTSLFVGFYSQEPS